ncbi:3-oxoacyl-ACP synthase, partial [Klebsiella pneumoniae]|nr:3-oxoacyl-ACP synthase [Klebsiella pneumoniae]
MLKDVFVTGVGSHLPGMPVASETMEDHIGRIHGKPSLLGRRALRWNGIETRHYALDSHGEPFD